MFRKYKSGSAKRQKKRKNEELINKQRGSINRFISLKRDTLDEDKALKSSDNNDEENNFKSDKQGESSKNEKDNLYEDKSFKSNNNNEEINLKSDEEASNNDSFRGSSNVLYTKSNGKFPGMIEMLAKFDPVILEHLNRIKNKEIHVHYLGHEIQDELIKMMAAEVKKKIIDLIKTTKYFSIIMDTTPDISHNEQLTILIRIVNIDEKNTKSVPVIKEYFLDFIDVKSTTGLHLSEILISQLKIYNIDLKDCRGQIYDNDSNMVGQFKGVESRISNISSRAFFTPYTAHSLNLVLCDAAKKSLRAITFLLLFIMNALEEVSNDTNDLVARSEALSLLKEISSYEFILSLIIWCDILMEANVVSKSLQNHNMDICVSTKLVFGLLEYFKNYRVNGYESAKIKSNELADLVGTESVFKKCGLRKKKKLFDYEANDEVIENEEEHFKITYFFVILDQPNKSLNKRFKQLESYSNNFGFLYHIGKLKDMQDDELIKCCKDLHLVLSDESSKEIDGQGLFAEIVIFRTLVDEEVTPLQALAELKKIGGSFPNITIAIRIMLTIPVASACAKRSFLKLKIIKSYLRNSIAQDKL
ncbi:hypothetical protein QTP88_022649 [Uroleucon formosanum]